jgi:hypothetical protein
VRPESKIDAALKAWIDNVLVPALVREHLKNLGMTGDGVTGDNDLSPNSQDSTMPESREVQ